MVKKSWRKRITEIVIAVLISYVFGTALLYLNQRNILYAAPKLSPEYISDRLSAYEGIQVITSDGLSLKGYFTPPSSPQKPIIIFFHGNAAHPAMMVPYFSQMVKDGYGVLLTEYRGYGGNPGSPTEDGLYKDAEAFFESDVLKRYMGVNPIIIYGQSLGSGAAVDLAQKHVQSIAALVLEVPFDSLLSVTERNYPFIPFQKFLLKDQYKSALKIGDVTVPKLFLLAGKDWVVGVDSGKRLFDLAHEPKQVIEYKEAGHNTVAEYGASSDVQKFIEGLNEK